MKEDYKIIKEKNGLTIAKKNMPHSAVVAINVLVKVGSRHENAELNGISHVIEHMCFKGTKNHDALAIAKAFEDLGAYFNAYTTRENTVFYVVGLREHYEILLKLLSEIVFDSVYDESELEKEKNVILQEIAHSFDNPDDVVFESLQKLCYPDYSIGRPVIGNKENVLKFNRDTIISFVNKNYSCNNVIVSVAGRIDHEMVRESVAKSFSHNSNNNESIFDVPKFVGGIDLIEKDLDQVHLAMSFKGVDYHDEDYYVAHLLSSILGDGMSSRLFQEIRENLGLVYTIQSFISPYHNAGTFGIFAGTDVNNLPKMLEAISKELQKICKNIDDQEIIRATNKFKANLLMSREVTSQRGSEMAADIAIYGRYIEPQEVIEKLEAITKDKLFEIANKIFSGKVGLSAIGRIGSSISKEKISEIFN